MLEIQVNGQALDGQLEDEKTLNDVVRSLENWFAGQDTIITGLEIDEQFVDPADRLFLMQRPVSSVKRINVITAALADLEGESSIEIMRYLSRLEASLHQNDEAIFSPEAREGVRWICGSLRLLSGIHHIDLGIFPSPKKPIAAALVVMEDAVTALDAASSDPVVRDSYRTALEESIQVLMVDAYDLLLLVNKRIDADGDIPAHAKHLAQAFAEHIGAVAAISADLQTGHEARAMVSIQKTVVLIEEMVRLMERSVRRYGLDMDGIMQDGESLQSWMNRLIEIGKNVITAFHNKDTVLLGDLFEYEVSQELDKVSGYLETLTAGMVGSNG